jgi:hypothetical protein
LIALVIVAAVGVSIGLVMSEGMRVATERVVRCMVQLDCREPAGSRPPVAPPRAAASTHDWTSFELASAAHASLIMPSPTAGRSPLPSPTEIAMASMVLAQASQTTEVPTTGRQERPIIDGGRDPAAVARCLEQGSSSAPATVFLPGILNHRGSDIYGRNAIGAQVLGGGPCVIAVPNGGGLPEGFEAGAEESTVGETVGVLRAAVARAHAVDLLVHSNGTAVLVRALQQLAAEGVHPPLGDITLVAPNVRAGGLEQLEAATHGKLTVVISTGDPALYAALFNDCNVDCVVDFVERHPEVRGVVLRMRTHSFVRQLEAARRLLAEEARQAARIGRPPRFPVHDVDTEEPG